MNRLLKISATVMITLGSMVAFAAPSLATCPHI